jgi:RHS repeat-associated protein
MPRIKPFALSLLAILAALLCPVTASAQAYLQDTGSPAYAVNLPVPNGYVNVANGNLHLEIPLATHKQRGALSLDEKLVYDSRIWNIVHYSGYYWWPLNIPNAQSGWRFESGNATGNITGKTVAASSPIQCANFSSLTYQIITYAYTWTDPSGTTHTFDTPWQYALPQGPCQETLPNGGSATVTGWATDASGYSVIMSGATNAPASSVQVKDPAGNEVAPQIIDRYGNYWSNDSNGNLIDDVGRTPVIATTNGNTTTYDVLAANGPINNNGTRVRYTVTTTQVTLYTSFNQSGVTEYQNNNAQPATITAVSSVQLPDGSSYSFQYDSYGAITQMTLPTGGVVRYGWTNYQDSYQNVQHWVGSSTIDNYTTTYTPAVLSQCSSSGTGCQEQVNVHRPSGDETVYTLTLDNGAWDTDTTVYAGAASRNQRKLQNVTTYDFTHACNNVICSGAQYITKATETQTLPDVGLSSQTQTSYSNPVTGQVTGVSQWDYYASSSSPSPTPTRSATYGYTGFDLTSETHYDSAGHAASSTTYSYTTTATATSDIVGHGSQNAGGPYLTSTTVTDTLTGTSFGSSTAYEDTGAVLSVQDPKSNVTSYKYDPTHTFVVEVDKPSTSTNGKTFNHITKATYDINSGAVLTTDDENSVANGQAYTVHYSYEAIAGRLQSVTAPLGAAKSMTYPSASEVDTAVAQKAGVNLTTATILDGYGRISQVSSAGVSSTYSYDSNGRSYGVSTPASSSSSATDGTTFTTYDTLNRAISVQNPDGTSRSLIIVGNTYTSKDELGIQKKQVLNAFGQISSVFEPDPASGALTLETDYKYDGLGNVTCVEQHGNISSTGCSSPASSDASSAWRVRRFLYNSLSQLRAASIPEHTSPTNSSTAQQNCGLGLGNSWTDCYSYDPNGNLSSATDNRGVTRSYAYDALNRPLLKTSPVGTTQDLSYDDGANGVGYLVHASNDINAASSYSYDALGRITAEWQCRPSNCGTGYVPVSANYDYAGNITSLTYPDGRVVGNQYDGSNHLSNVNYVSWNGNLVNTPYWSAGSYLPPGILQSANYGNGVQMQAQFNNRLSLTSLSYQATGASSQTYFSKGYTWDKNASNLTLEANQLTSQVRQFGYDQMNRLVSAIDVTAPSTHATATANISGLDGFTLNCSGGGSNPTPVRPSPSASPNCQKVWDAGNLSITVGGYTVSTPYGNGSTSAQLAAGLSSLLNASGSPVTATASGTTITLTSVAVGGSANYALSWTTDQDFSISFSASTMTGGSSGVPVAGGMNQQYALDAWGNLSSMGASGFSQPINTHNQVSTFAYDAAGRLLTDAGISYTYDDDGMLLSSTDGTSYVYDAQNRRAQISVGGTAKEYYYFGGELVATLSPATGAWTDMIYAGGQRVASVAGNQTAVPVYLLPDHVDSEGASVDGSGNTTALDYSPFGQTVSGTTADNFVFTGLERDHSGLDHAGYRQYSSTTGRWTTPDPYNGSYDFGDPQSLNRYSYVGNRPLTLVDPSGLQNGDPIHTGGDDCEWLCTIVGAIGQGLADLFGFRVNSTFQGNVNAQSQGKLLRRVNADGSINSSPGGPDGAGSGPGPDFSGFTNGQFYIHGDTTQAPSNQITGDNGVYHMQVNVLATAAVPIQIPEIPFPEIPWPSTWPSIPWPSIPWPTWMSPIPPSSKWSKFPGCSIQYSQDAAICARRNTSSCWSSAADRLAYCNRTGGEVGWPPLNR